MENIVRLRKANEEKKKLNEQIKTQGQPKNYTGQMTKFQPFKLHTEETKKKGNPNLIIEVTIGPGKTGKKTLLEIIGVIGIHPDDDPRQLAVNFCKIYHLNSEAEDALFKIILENMNTADFKELQAKKLASQGIDPIEEARENDEQTSYNMNTNKSGINDNSKSLSYNASASRSKINHTNNKNIQSQFLTPEQDEEILKSFNRDNSGNNRSGFDASGFEDHQMMDGEDVAYSPDSSIRIPHTSFTDEGVVNDRQHRFQNDRMASIHAKQENKYNAYSGHVRSTNGNLESVKEEMRESESRIHYPTDSYNNFDEFDEEYRGSTMQHEDTEVIVAEVDSAELERFGKTPVTHHL